MKRIFVQCPPVPSTWSGSRAAWEEIWRRIDADLRTVPLARADFYFAHERMDVWVWCRGTNARGAIEYWVWCFNSDEEEFIGEELLPQPNQPSRLRSSTLHVSIVLPDVPILHVERLGKDEKDRRLKGEKVRLGRVVPEMPGGF